MPIMRLGLVVCAALGWLMGAEGAGRNAQQCRRLPPVTDEAGPPGTAPVSWLLAGERSEEGEEYFGAGLSDGGPETGERLIDRATDPLSWLMTFMFRDEIVVPTVGTDEELNQLDFRTQLPFHAFGKFNIARVEVQYNISSADGDGLEDVMLYDLVVTETSWGKWGIGPSMCMVPESSPKGSTFQAGPAAGVIHLSEHWTVGMMMQNYLSSQYCETDIEPVLVYKVNEQLMLGIGDLKFEFDWTAGNWIQVPLGLELGYIADVGGQHILFFANPQYNLRNSDGNQEWQFYFGLTLLVPQVGR
jgi:hypothetical protein